MPGVVLTGAAEPNRQGSAFKVQVKAKMFSSLLLLFSAAAAEPQASLVVEPGRFGPEVELELQQRCGDAVVLQSACWGCKRAVLVVTGSQCVAELRRFSAEYNGTLLADARLCSKSIVSKALVGYL